MKKLLLLSLLTLSLTVSAQTSEKPTRSISAEFLGAHLGYGINYDSRFKGNEGTGYRVGLSYSHLFPGQDQETHGVAVPLELNYLFGSKVLKFELGGGSTVGYYHTRNFATAPDHPEEIKNRIGFIPFLNAGIRLQPKRGLTLRLGVTPIWAIFPYPYISVGYAF